MKSNVKWELYESIYIYVCTDAFGCVRAYVCAYICLCIVVCIHKFAYPLGCVKMNSSFVSISNSKVRHNNNKTLATSFWLLRRSRCRRCDCDWTFEYSDLSNSDDKTIFEHSNHLRMRLSTFFKNFWTQATYETQNSSFHLSLFDLCLIVLLYIRFPSSFRIFSNVNWCHSFSAILIERL